MTDQEDAFVERFAEVLARTGWPRMSARIFACLMATPRGSLTAAALSARLGVGPSAISNGAKLLRTLRLVEARRENDRQILYEVHPDAWMEAVASREDDLAALERILVEGVRALRDPSACDRLTETADFFAFLRQELPAIVERWRATR